MLLFSFFLQNEISAAEECSVAPELVRNAWESQQRRFEAYIDEAGRNMHQARGLVALLKAEDMLDSVPHPEVIERLYAQITAADKASLDMRLAALWGRHRLASEKADFDGITRSLDALGLIRHWAVIGPFDNEGGIGHDREYPPESVIDPSAVYEGKIRPVAWREYPDINGVNGWQSFSTVFNPSENVSAYAYTEIRSDKARKVLLWLAAGGAVKVWLNDRLIYDLNIDRNPYRWDDALETSLGAGVNRILVKVSVKEGAWGFRLGLLDEKGNAIQGLQAVRHGEKGTALPSESRMWTQRSMYAKFHPLAIRELETVLSEKGVPQQKRAETALMLAYLYRETGNYDRPSRMDEERISKALALAPKDPECHMLAARIFRDHNRRYAHLLEAARLMPDSGRPALALGRFYRRQGLETESLRQYDKAALDPRTLAGAVAGRGIIYNNHGLAACSLNEKTQLAAVKPAPRRVALMLAAQLDRAGRSTAAAAVRQELRNAVRSDTGTARRLYDYHRGRADFEASLEIIKEIIRFQQTSLSDRLSHGRLLEGRGLLSEAAAVFENTLEIAPEEPSVIKRLALFEQRHGDLSKATALYNRSLQVFPQDPETKQHLEFLKPGAEGIEKEFARDAREVIAAHPLDPEADYAAEELLDLNVNRVFENGLSSAYYQRMVRILDESGIKRFNSFWIGYSPSRQNLKVLKARVFKPDGSIVERVNISDDSLSQDYRIYYDTSATRIYFPDLEKGDVVEVSWKLDDTAQDNLFADYFGKLYIFQGAVPVREQIFSVIMPKSRKLYYNKPRLQPEPLLTERGEDLMYSWAIKNVPEIKPEPSTPPWLEISDYLHVSTFADYNEMGRWYWNLVKDQWQAKDELKKTAWEIAGDAKDSAEKVRRIYNWVITKTRYIGLEFGVHGYKPYQVNQVFERKFGDCKDKASLLMTMLNEVGVKAEFVVIRTGDLGLIGPYPASLASFNHAIVYVPELDIYLDGTAEFTGIRETPAMDSRATLIRLNPQGATLTQSPDQNFKKNRHTENFTLKISGGHDATIHSEITIEGSEAPRFRSHFQDRLTRREKLEKLINQSYPGARIDSFRFKSLNDFEQPVQMTFDAILPDYVRIEGEELVVKALFSGIDLVRQYASISERRLPLYIKNLKTTEMAAFYEAAPGLELSETPEDLKLESDYADFEISFVREGENLRVKMRLVSKRNIVPVEDYPAFREFCRKVTKAAESKVRWRHAVQ